MVRAWIAMVIVLSTLSVACNPLSDDDPTATRRPEPTREVIVATFTPTAVVPPAGQTATAGAQATSAAMTATEQAVNPQPTVTFANPTAPPEDMLTPPMATLTASSEQVAATLESYGWVYSDADQTVAAITAPIVQFEYDPVTIENGQEVIVSLSGREFRSLPESMEGGIYNFEDNSAYPTNQQGESGDELAFVVNTDPDQALELDPAVPASLSTSRPDTTAFGFRATGRLTPA